MALLALGPLLAAFSLMLSALLLIFLRWSGVEGLRRKSFSISIITVLTFVFTFLVVSAPNAEDLNGGSIVQNGFFDFDWNSNLTSNAGQAVFALNFAFALTSTTLLLMVCETKMGVILSASSFLTFELFQVALAKGVFDLLDLLPRFAGLATAVAMFLVIKPVREIPAPS